MVIDPSTGHQTWQGVMVDLTAARQTEADLRSSERRYRALVEQVPAIMYEMGPDDERRTLFVSPHVEEILGLPAPGVARSTRHLGRAAAPRRSGAPARGARPAQRDRRVVAPGVPPHRERRPAGMGARPGRARVRRRRRSMARRHARHLSAEGSRSHAAARQRRARDARAHPHRAARGRQRDDDARDRRAQAAEDKLRQTEERFRALVEHMPGVAYTWHVPSSVDADQAGTLSTYTNPRIEDLLGFTVAEWEGDARLWETRVHPHDRERVLAASERSSITGELFNEEFRYLAKDGRVVWVLERATLLSRDDKGRPQFFQGLILDITDRKRRRRRRQRLPRSGSDCSPNEGRSSCTSSPSITPSRLEIEMRYLQPVGCRDAERADVRMGREPRGVALDDAPRRRRAHDPARRDEISVSGAPWTHVFRMIAGDGRVVWVLDRGQATQRDDQGRPRLFQGILLDVTEEAELHASLEVSEAAFRSVVEDDAGRAVDRGRGPGNRPRPVHTSSVRKSKRCSDTRRASCSPNRITSSGLSIQTTASAWSRPAIVATARTSHGTSCTG